MPSIAAICGDRYTHGGVNRQCESPARGRTDRKSQKLMDSPKVNIVVYFVLWVALP